MYSVLYIVSLQSVNSKPSFFTEKKKSRIVKIRKKWYIEIVKKTEVFFKDDSRYKRRRR